MYKASSPFYVQTLDRTVLMDLSKSDHFGGLKCLHRRRIDHGSAAAPDHQRHDVFCRVVMAQQVHPDSALKGVRGRVEYGDIGLNARAIDHVSHGPGWPSAVGNGAHHR